MKKRFVTILLAPLIGTISYVVLTRSVDSRSFADNSLAQSPIHSESRPSKQRVLPGATEPQAAMAREMHQANSAGPVNRTNGEGGEASPHISLDDGQVAVHSHTRAESPYNPVTSVWCYSAQLRDWHKLQEFDVAEIKTQYDRGIQSKTFTYEAFESKHYVVNVDGRWFYASTDRLAESVALDRFRGAEAVIARISLGEGSALTEATAVVSESIRNFSPDLGAVFQSLPPGSDYITDLDSAFVVSAIAPEKTTVVQVPRTWSKLYCQGFGSGVVSSRVWLDRTSRTVTLDGIDIELHLRFVLAGVRRAPQLKIPGLLTTGHSIPRSLHKGLIRFTDEVSEPLDVDSYDWKLSGCPGISFRCAARERHRGAYFEELFFLSSSLDSIDLPFHWRVPLSSKADSHLRIGPISEKWPVTDVQSTPYFSGFGAATIVCHNSRVSERARGVSLPVILRMEELDTGYKCAFDLDCTDQSFQVVLGVGSWEATIESCQIPVSRVGRFTVNAESTQQESIRVNLGHLSSVQLELEGLSSLYEGQVRLQLELPDGTPLRRLLFLSPPYVVRGLPPVDIDVYLTSPISIADYSALVARDADGSLIEGDPFGGAPPVPTPVLRANASGAGVHIYETIAVFDEEYDRNARPYDLDRARATRRSVPAVR